KRGWGDTSEAGRGSIPAYAGETESRHQQGNPSEVDSRVCGGNHEFRFRPDAREGRSPRMRGKLQGGPFEREGPGSIPAYAGETSRPSINDSRPRVDPRVCGG